MITIAVYDCTNNMKVLNALINGWMRKRDVYYSLYSHLLMFILYTLFFLFG